MTELSYRLTNHAVGRISQRSIPVSIIDLIMDYGESCDAGDGARKFALSRRSLREIRKARAVGNTIRLNHFRRAYVVATNETIITAAFSEKAIFH